MFLATELIGRDCENMKIPRLKLLAPKLESLVVRGGLASAAGNIGDYDDLAAKRCHIYFVTIDIRDSSNGETAHCFAFFHSCCLAFFGSRFSL